MHPEDSDRYPTATPMDHHYLPTGQPLNFNCAAVKPFQCLNGGWRLVKGQYGLYIGMCLLIILLLTCIPFTGLIWGAWNAGIYLALLGRMRGETTSFNSVTKGFDYFRPAFVVAFFAGLPFGLVGVGVKLANSWLDQITRTYTGNRAIPPEVLREMLMIFGGLVVLYIFCYLVTGVIFAFAYPLVVEHKLSGWQATKASAHAARRNFGGVVGLLLLDLALSAIGVMLCFIGFALTMPITKASWAVAYKQVFPEPPQVGTVSAPPSAYGNQPLPPDFSRSGAGNGKSTLTTVAILIGFGVVLLVAVGGGLLFYLKHQAKQYHCEVAGKPEPQTAGDYLERASEHAYAGELDCALGACAETIRLEPKKAAGYGCRGNILRIKNDYDGALKDFAEGLRLEPDNAILYANRGILYEQKGDTDLAIADFSNAIRLDPTNRYSYENRAKAYRKLGQSERAEADETKAKTISASGTRDSAGPSPSPKTNPTSTRTISGGVLNGKAISLPKPEYPAIARAAHASGTVVVQIVVDENGEVMTAHAVSGHPLLQATAVAAARQAKFGPIKVSGQPVKVSGVLIYNFAEQ